MNLLRNEFSQASGLNAEERCELKTCIEFIFEHDPKIKSPIKLSDRIKSKKMGRFEWTELQIRKFLTTTEESFLPPGKERELLGFVETLAKPLGYGTKEMPGAQKDPDLYQKLSEAMGVTVDQAGKAVTKVSYSTFSKSFAEHYPEVKLPFESINKFMLGRGNIPHSYGPELRERLIRFSERVSSGEIVLPYKAGIAPAAPQVS